MGPDGITNGGWRSGASPDYPQICVREAGKVTRNSYSVLAGKSCNSKCISLFNRCPDIPSDASITYELELLDVQGPVDFAKVSEEELMTLV